MTTGAEGGTGFLEDFTNFFLGGGFEMRGILFVVFGELAQLAEFLLPSSKWFSLPRAEPFFGMSA